MAGVWGEGGKQEVGILVVLLSAGEGKGQNSLEWDFMQMRCY